MAHIVTRKNGFAIDFQTQQVAYGIRVFGPVQAMNAGSSGVRLLDRGAVEL